MIISSFKIKNFSIYFALTSFNLESIYLDKNISKLGDVFVKSIKAKNVSTGAFERLNFFLKSFLFFSNKSGILEFLSELLKIPFNMLSSDILTLETL